MGFSKKLLDKRIRPKEDEEFLTKRTKTHMPRIQDRNLLLDPQPIPAPAPAPAPAQRRKKSDFYIPSVSKFKNYLKNNVTGNQEFLYLLERTGLKNNKDKGTVNKVLDALRDIKNDYELSGEEIYQLEEIEEIEE